MSNRCFSSSISSPKCPNSDMNRQTARQQTDGVKDRNIENVLRRRPRQALADIEEIGHDKDREDCSLGSDQGEHPDASARGKIPLDFLLGYRYGRRFHRLFHYSYFQSGSAGCFRSHSGRRLLISGMEAKL